MQSVYFAPIFDTTICVAIQIYSVHACECVGFFFRSADEVRMENYSIFKCQKCNTEEFLFTCTKYSARTEQGVDRVFIFDIFEKKKRTHFPVVVCWIRICALSRTTRLSIISPIFPLRWPKCCVCEEKIVATTAWQPCTHTHRHARSYQLISNWARCYTDRIYSWIIVRPLGVWHCCFYGYALCMATNLEAFMPFGHTICVIFRAMTIFLALVCVRAREFGIKQWEITAVELTVNCLHISFVFFSTIELFEYLNDADSFFSRCSRFVWFSQTKGSWKENSSDSVTLIFFSFSLFQKRLNWWTILLFHSAEVRSSKFVRIYR